MARARLLKPGFFSNERLADLPMSARLLFAGLWLLVDREGRINDRPRFIKGALFPYENVPVDSLLTKLADAEFIVRYESEGERYIQVVNFLKHQSPHQNETASLLPGPDNRSNGGSARPDGETNPAVSKYGSDSGSYSGSGESTAVPVPVTAPNGSGPTSAPAASLSGSSPDLPTPDYAFARELWANGIGRLSTDITRTLREDLAYNAPWCIHAIQETAAAPKPSFEYYAAIIQRTRDDHKPPASYAKSHR